MKKLLLHVCCAPCSTESIERLKSQYQITLFFYNPCIYPEEEYEKRLEEVKKLSKKLDIPLIEGDYNYKHFKKLVKGHEKDPEGGFRCLLCYEQRLKKTAQYAKAFDFFTTTLTISPHKNSKKIFEIAKECAKVSKSNFLEIDFKKQDGFRKSVELSKKHNLYRQDYCGCEFSIK